MPRSHATGRRSRTRKTSPSPSRKGSAAALAAAPPKSLTKGSRVREAVGPDDFRPRPSHFRILRAYAEVMDSGGPVSWAAIARAAGVTREYLWQIRRRYPGLEPWLMAHARAAGQQMVDAVFQKLAVMALRGSVAHAEAYFKALSGGFRSEQRGETSVNVTVEGPRIVNLAIPRPGDQPVAVGASQEGT